MLGLRSASSAEARDSLVRGFSAPLTCAQLGQVLLQLPEPEQRLRAARALGPLLEDHTSNMGRVLDGIPFAEERVLLLAALSREGCDELEA